MCLPTTRTEVNEQKPSFTPDSLARQVITRLTSRMHFPPLVPELFVKRRLETTMENRIQLGSTCVLRDLQAQPTWNGIQVVVLEYLNDEGRFRVQPSDARTNLPSSLSVLPRNLKPLGRLSPVPCNGDPSLCMETGTICVLQGLHSKVFNGEKVMVLHYINEEARYQVRPLSPSSTLPPLLAIKPENLVPEDDDRVCPVTLPTSRRSPFASLGRGVFDGKTKTDASSVHSVPLPLMRPVQEMHRRQASSRPPMTRFVGKSVSVSALQPFQSSRPLPPPPPTRRLVGKSYSSSALQPFQPPTAASRGGPMSRGSSLQPVPFHPSPPSRTPSQSSDMMHHSCSSLDFDCADPPVAPLGRRIELSRMGSVPIMRSTSASVSLLGGRSLHGLGESGNHNRNGVARTQSLRGPELVRIPSMRLRNTDSERQLSVNEGSDRMLDLPRRRPSLTKTTSVSDLPGSSRPLTSEPVGAPDLQLGSKAHLTGLQAQASLNGKEVLIQDYVEVHGHLRYRVRLLDDEASVSSHDLVIHRRNLVELPELDSGSVGSSHARKYRPGDRLRLAGLVSRPHMNGHMVEVVEYVKETKRYLVLPADIEASDACDMGIMSVAFENLVPESPCVTGNEVLPDGSRVVLEHVPGKHTLNGELAMVVQHQPESKSYRLRLLGETAVGKHNGVDLLDVPSHAVKAAQATSMWVNMVVKGKTWRVPTVCQVESGRLVVRLDAFPGIDSVVPIAKVLMGEDSCDWMHDGEVLALLREHPSNPLNCTVLPESNEVMVEPSMQAKNPFFRAMVEYELLKPTTKTMGNTDSESGELIVFQVIFPCAAVDSVADAKDDENPFRAQVGETEESDANPFTAANKPSGNEVDPMDYTSRLRTPERTPSVSTPVDCTLVEEALTQLLLSRQLAALSRPPSFYQERSPREGCSPKPDPPGRHEESRVASGKSASAATPRGGSRSRSGSPDARGEDHSSSSSSPESSPEGNGRVRSKDKDKKKKKKKKDKDEKKKRTKSRSTSRPRSRPMPVNVGLVAV